MSDTTKKDTDKLSLVQRYELMHAVKTQHGKGLTDGEFAAQAAEQLGFKCSPSTVATYREAFGIEAVKSASAAELRARVRELEAQLRAEPAAV